MSGQDYSCAIQVGDIVYLPFSPVSLGKVVEVRQGKERSSTGGRYDQEVRVVWRKAKKHEPQWLPGYHLNRLEDLIADHEAKLDGHKKRLKEMQKWSGT